MTGRKWPSLNALWGEVCLWASVKGKIPTVGYSALRAGPDHNTGLIQGKAYICWFIQTTV